MVRRVVRRNAPLRRVIPRSLIVSRWVNATRKFWTAAPSNYEYFWMDRIFARLAQTDPEFLASWKRVLYLWCESQGSAHSLAGRLYDPPDRALLKSIRETVPFTVKLDWKGNFHPNTNAWQIIEWALTRREGPPITWQEPPPFDSADFFTTTDSACSSVFAAHISARD